MPCSRKLPVALYVALGVRAAGAALTVALTPDSAQARRTVIARDGFYGRVGTGGTSLMFRVRDRKIYKFKFNLTLVCRNSDTGEEYDRYFDAGRNAPQGRRVPRDGLWQASWTETSALREGNVVVSIDFNRNQPMVVVNIDVPQRGSSYETCFATYEWPVRRGQ